jgi:HEAT repeat protein
VDSLVLALTSRLSSRSRGYLLELGPGLLPEIYPYLNDEDASLRAELADLLADLGDPEAAAKLAPLVNDPNPKVADRANRAVERLRNGAAAASR